MPRLKVDVAPASGANLTFESRLFGAVQRLNARHRQRRQPLYRLRSNSPHQSSGFVRGQHVLSAPGPGSLSPGDLPGAGRRPNGIAAGARRLQSPVCRSTKGGPESASKAYSPPQQPLIVSRPLLVSGLQDRSLRRNRREA